MSLSFVLTCRGLIRYPSDADKHLLARQTGLSRNQVSNWFINARVRLWKPMVEEMYQRESKDIVAEESQRDQSSSSSGHINNSQTPSPHVAATPSAIVDTKNNPLFISANMSFTASNSAALPLPTMHASDVASQSHAHVESALRGLGPSSGDVSLTLGLRHAGNSSDKKSFLG